MTGDENNVLILIFLSSRSHSDTFKTSTSQIGSAAFSQFSSGDYALHNNMFTYY